MPINPGMVILHSAAMVLCDTLSAQSGGYGQDGAGGGGSTGGGRGRGGAGIRMSKRGGGALPGGACHFHAEPSKCGLALDCQSKHFCIHPLVSSAGL